MSSSDFNKISAKDEDWKYLGKKIFELNDIEIGSTKEIQQSDNSDIDINGFSYIVNSDKKHVKITNINDISEPLIDNSIKRPFDKFNIEQFEKVTGSKFVGDASEDPHARVQNNVDAFLKSYKPS